MALTINLLTSCCLLNVLLYSTSFDVSVSAQLAASSNTTEQFLNVLFTKYGNGSYIPISRFNQLLNKLAIGQVFVAVDSTNKVICMNNTRKEIQTISTLNHPSDKPTKDESQTVATTPSAKKFHVVRSTSQYHNKSEKDTRSLRHKQHMQKHHDKCQTSEELLRLYNLKPGQDLSQKDFLGICPSIISQIESGVCLHQHSCFFNKMDDDNQGLPTTYKVWAYGFIAVTVISLTSLCVIAIIPCLEKSCFNAIMGYLVALAVGTLAGDALLHLIPHSLDNDKKQENKESNHRDGVWTMCVVLVGIYLFFLVEQLTRIKSLCCKGKSRTENKGKYRQNTETELISVGESTPVKIKISDDEKMLTDHVFLPVVEKGCEKSNHKCDELCDRFIEDSAVGSTSSPSGSRGVSPTSDSGPCCPDHDLSESLISPVLNETTALKDSNQNKYEDTGHNQQYKQHNSHGHSHGNSHGHSHHSSPGHSHGHGHSHGEITKKTSIATVAWMVIIGDGFHNFSDGLAIGAAFAASYTSGLSTSIAVFCHELPHELGDFAVLVKSGMSVKQAITYNLVSAVLSYVGLVVGIIVGNYASGRQFALALTAGLFLYVALASMLPSLSSTETLEQNSSRTIFITQNLGILTGIGLMLVISVFEDKF